ncbi:hypothetical protein ACLB2K_047263 [Fragaria x ananassa]
MENTAKIGRSLPSQSPLACFISTGVIMPNRKSRTDRAALAFNDYSNSGGLGFGNSGAYEAKSSKSNQ